MQACGFSLLAWNVIFDILKGSMATLAIVLDGQQLLAEERNEFCLG